MARDQRVATTELAHGGTVESVSATQTPVPPAPAPGGAGSQTSVIQTESLTKVYQGGTRAVDQLSLSILEGEIFGLLGPNGAGKTTTVGLLTTRIVPTEG